MSVSEIVVERMIGDRTFSLSTGKLARQADGAVVARYGDTVVLAAVVAAPLPEGIDFFPLTVDYREKLYAAGKFPGGFIKREGRPTNKEILTSRLIDRSIRPLFPKSFKHEVQVQIITLSADGQNDPDVISMVAASAALAVSGLPFEGPVGSLRVGRIAGEFVLMPLHQQLGESDLDLVVSGTRDAVLMIEGFGRELPEQDFLSAIRFAHEQYMALIEMQEELRERAGVSVPEIKEEEEENPYLQTILDRYAAAIREAYRIREKRQRRTAVDELKTRIREQLVEECTAREQVVDDLKLFDAIQLAERAVVRQMILEGIRPDGRGHTDLREIYCEVGVMPRTHGSALFTRGETQALVTTTLGTTVDAQKVDGIMGEYSKKFYLDYNMPPFSVGEVRPIRGPSRREIGHGALAERSLKPLVPDPTEFPYTIRVVSDILESNGSSSMASVCGGSLSLMDAGVPIRKAAAGVSIGLVYEGDDRYALLTDILGDEDHCGDMDFKVAGTDRGITGIQLDLKIKGLPDKLIAETLERAREARLKILEIMNRTIDRPRPSVAPHAPHIVQVRINPEKIGLVIGPGGRMIRLLEQETDASIEIEEDGTITVSADTDEKARAAAERIRLMTEDVQVGKIYTGRVVDIRDFGAILEILPGKEALCHISELDTGYVRDVTDICQIGDEMQVKVISVDENDRVKVSRRAVLEEQMIGDDLGESVVAEQRPHARSGRDHSRSGGRRHQGRSGGGHRRGHHGSRGGNRGGRHNR